MPTNKFRVRSYELVEKSTNYQLRTNNSLGFTLIELLVVITILAILAMIGLTTYGTFLKSGRDTKRQADLSSLQSALEQYNADQKFYPSSITTFGTALTNCTGAPTPCTVSKTYLNQTPTDPGATSYTYGARPTGCDNSDTNRCNNYCLWAKSETLPVSTLNTACNSFPSGGYNYLVTKP